MNSQSTGHRTARVAVLLIATLLAGCPPVMKGAIRNTSEQPIEVVMTETSTSRPANPGKITKAYVWLWDCVHLSIDGTSRYFKIDDTVDLPDDVFRRGLSASRVSLTFDGNALYLESPSQGLVQMMEMDSCEWR